MKKRTKEYSSKIFLCRLLLLLQRKERRELRVNSPGERLRMMAGGPPIVARKSLWLASHSLNQIVWSRYVSSRCPCRVDPLFSRPNPLILHRRRNLFSLDDRWCKWKAMSCWQDSWGSYERHRRYRVEAYFCQRIQKPVAEVHPWFCCGFHRRMKYYSFF